MSQWPENWQSIDRFNDRSKDVKKTPKAEEPSHPFPDCGHRYAKNHGQHYARNKNRCVLRGLPILLGFLCGQLKPRLDNSSNFLEVQRLQWHSSASPVRCLKGWWRTLRQSLFQKRRRCGTKPEKLLQPTSWYFNTLGRYQQPSPSFIAGAYIKRIRRADSSSSTDCR